ncbi:sodium/glutamate symporter [Planococcus beigongshangi]|uniref:sodium/glutamate symporter n=1 Tax=Planococcus beigongshangi TaxID=2782536 RepID=UPI00193C3A89|nr:sodium/glutamate symporter [Planococcus beigongshangi]
MQITFDILQSVGLAVIVFYIGKWIKSRVKILQNFFIPAPVIGGILFSLLVFAGYQTNIINISLDASLQDFFMNIFFTCIGFSVSLPLIKKSGKQGAILAVVAVVFLIIQNLVGVSLASLFGLDKLLGIAMGSISMSGGVGSGAAFGPTLEALGADGGTVVGVASATFGLMIGCVVGGPVAKRLIDKYKLSSTQASGKHLAEEKEESVLLVEANVLNSVLLVLIAAAGGSIISYLLNLTGLTFPYYVGCLFGGTIVRILADVKLISVRMKEVDIIGNISLNLFLTMALMSLEIWKLFGLALPMIIILLVQTIIMMIYAYFVTFRSMGKNYEAAVMAAGHIGVGLGQTPNAIANMSAIIEKNGPAPNAWFVLPVITVVFINIFNPIIITLFINVFS